MQKKFELTDESKINSLGIKLFRIKALVKGKYYEAGEIGGWIENLELKSGNARISGNAWVSGNAEVYGNARVSGNAEVYGNARVCGKLRIDFILCSRFKFESDFQIKLWQELESQFEKKCKDMEK